MLKSPERLKEQRFAAWRELRQHLETSKSPFDDVVNFFNQFPKAKFYTDPYDQSTWPTAWELIEENEYCRFNLILGICYTLQLCERFQNSSPTITIAVDKQTNSVYYLLSIDNMIYGYEDEAWLTVDRLPKSLKNIKIYNLPALH